jgi:hypothetical protein
MYTESMIVHFAECLAQHRSVVNNHPRALIRIARALRKLIAALAQPASRSAPRTSTPSKLAPARR